MASSVAAEGASAASAAGEVADGSLLVEEDFGVEEDDEAEGEGAGPECSRPHRPPDVTPSSAAESAVSARAALRLWRWEGG